MRALLPIGLALSLTAGPAHALGLYEASTIVTGTDLRSRPAGLTETLGQVLAKVSGNPALATDPRLASIDPAPLLRGLLYLDRMTDLPRRDEQGTRDRPFTLQARFDPAGIAALLATWHEHPWPEPRPSLDISVTITPQRGEPYRLMADTAPDERHRQALTAAADRTGLPVVLPAATQPGPPPGNIPLDGTLVWSDPDFGWIATWTLHTTQDWHWQTRGGSFDAAYRDALGHAALILSGHQDPAR